MSNSNPAGNPTQVWLISANDLLLGGLVYLASDGHWTRKLADAAVLTDQEQAESQLEQALRQSNLVLGAELIDAQLTKQGEIELTHFRDRFRESGPTHRNDLSRINTNLNHTTAARGQENVSIR